MQTKRYMTNSQYRVARTRTDASARWICAHRGAKSIAAAGGDSSALRFFVAAASGGSSALCFFVVVASGGSLALHFLVATASRGGVAIRWRFIAADGFFGAKS